MLTYQIFIVEIIPYLQIGYKYNEVLEFASNNIIFNGKTIIPVFMKPALMK